jgi:hypothetical protein
VARDVAHHFLCCRSGRRALVLPRAKQRFSFDERAQMALMEVSGVAILNEASAFDAGSASAVGEAELVRELRSFALDDALFGEICNEEAGAERARAATA